jgi:hypothetical protein
VQLKMQTSPIAPPEKGESHAQTCFPVDTALRAHYRWPRQRAGIVPDHGAGRRESHPEIPDLVLSEAPRETRAYAIKNYVADLAALLDTLGIDVERGLSRAGYARRDQRVVHIGLRK